MRKIRFFSILLVSCLSITGLYANAGDAGVGASLFQGTKHFKNGGVACIACHTVNSSLVEGGGKLAMNLTTMGGAGIQYTIAKPENASSPIMRDAFKGKPLTASEQIDLVAFFNKVANNNVHSSNTFSKFIIGGVIGGILIFLILALLGKKRKQQCVNQELFDRQLKSSWKEFSK